MWKETEGNVLVEPGNATNWSERMIRLQNLRDWVAENLRLAHQRQARYINPSRREITFQVGDQVLVINRVLSNAAKNFAAKLADKFRSFHNH